MVVHCGDGGIPRRIPQPRRDFGAWQGVLAPAGTPPETVARLNAEINAVLRESEASPALTKAASLRSAGRRTSFAS